MPKRKSAAKYCASYGCSNNEKNTWNVHLFRFPSDVERCNKWLELIGRDDLLKKKDIKISSHYVCSAHFEDSDIEITTLTKLKGDALPSEKLNNMVAAVSVETQTEEVCLLNSDTRDEWLKQSREMDLKNPDIKYSNRKACILNFDDSVSEQSVTKMRSVAAVPARVETQPSTSKNQTTFMFRTYNVMTQTDITMYDRQIDYSGNEDAHTSVYTDSASAQRKIKIETNLEDSEKKMPFEKALEKMNKQIHDKDPLYIPSDKNSLIYKRYQKFIQWQNDMKEKQKDCPEFNFFALNLYLSSPQFYQSLKTMLKLPSVTKLIKFKLNIRPELDEKVFNCLSSKFQSLPDAAKYCTLCVDVITLKPHVYYDVTNDGIIGLHNINGKVKDEVASYAYVIMLRSIAVNWKQPVAFALLARNEHYNELGDWINEIITKLCAIGIKVMAIVSDQEPIFNKSAKEYRKVTTKKPYFTVKGNRIYYIFDVPHMLTCLRNNLLENDFFFDGERISWEYIETMYHYQREQHLGLLPNVTYAHIDPKNHQKTKLTYAAQIFSQRVHGALNTFIYAEFLPEEAKATADFIKPINDTFDILNSNSIKNSNKYKQAFRLNDEQTEVLKTVKDIFRNITAFCPTTGTNNTNRITTFENFQISIQAIIMLSKDLKQEGLDHIFTRRLNHEPLKKFLGSIRLPTVGIKFKRTFSKLFLSNIVKNSTSSYYQEDLCDLLLRENIMKETGTSGGLPNSFEFKSRLVSIGGERDYRFDLPSKDAIIYAAGYLLFKCSEKHHCPQFEAYLKNGILFNDHKTYTHFKDINKNFAFHEHLKMPSESFLNCVKRLEATFLNKFIDIISKNPANRLLPILQEVLIYFQMPCSCFPSEYLLRLFIRFRIFATLRYNHKNIRLRTQNKRCYFEIKPL